MSEPKIQFPNFKEAYCAAYGCKPENFDHQVFWKCVYRRALPLVVVIWAVERRMFQPDLEVIRALGAASSAVELQAVMGEFDNRCMVERSIRRAMFRMRVSGARLSSLFSGLLPLIKPPEPSPVMIEPRQSPQDIAAREGPENRDARENAGAVVRRLKRFHADIVGGRPLSDALAQLGVDLGEAAALLGQHRAGRPELGWLHDHLAERGQIEWLRAENARLTRQAAEMSAKLSAGRGGR
jgi:hypothetical protein